jgi:hypothetical protein
VGEPSWCPCAPPPGDTQKDKASATQHGRLSTALLRVCPSQAERPAQVIRFVTTTQEALGDIKEGAILSFHVAEILFRS